MKEGRMFGILPSFLFGYVLFLIAIRQAADLLPGIIYLTYLVHLFTKINEEARAKMSVAN